MAATRKKARQRVSYGRDGTLFAWDLNFPLQHTSPSNSVQSSSTKVPSSLRRQVQAHTHWVNDIALVHNNSALVSASSDCSVKLWEPHSETARLPTTIGQHSDYVKCLASPGPSLDWIASGGLDHKIRIWDLNTAQQKLEINALEQEKDNAKGSVYTLSIAGGIMASGGPEGAVRAWDYRSGRRIAKFMGHTDKLNSILINGLGDTVMTASSDRTIKVWSLTAGRCMHTLTMHNDSVWSLWSDHPDLAVFYSTDRSGMIVKTDVRYSQSLDEALSVVVAKEHEGVSKLALAGDYIWTATASSSINRWRNVSTDLEAIPGTALRHERHGSLATRARGLSDAGFNQQIPDSISKDSVLRTTDAARYSASVSKLQDLEGSGVLRSPVSGRKHSGIFVDLDADEASKPIRTRPEETIEGQNGLTRHVLLNDRRRVLTSDTAGEIMLWDLIRCAPIKSFGKRHIDDVANELFVQDSVPNWCTLDTKTGRLTVALEENYAFEAEVYADDLELAPQADAETDDQQRIIYGRWILRYLFDGLVQAELEHDRQFREELVANRKLLPVSAADVPKLETLPETTVPSLQLNTDNSFGITSRNGTNGSQALTPGFGIGLATPGIPLNSPGTTAQSPMLSARSPGSEVDKTASRPSGDYFSRGTTGATTANVPPISKGDDTTENQDADETAKSPSEDKEAKGSFFSGKSFRMKFPKKLGRTSEEAPKAEEEKTSEADKASVKDEPTFEESFLGTIESIRHSYKEQLAANPLSQLTSFIRLTQPQDTPELVLPSHTEVVIQEERSDAGGVVDLYRGTIASVGQEVEELEKVAPQWLGDLLLKNSLPVRDPNRSKQPFVLLPMTDKLPDMANGEGNSRLTAPRVLRAKKILEYVAERVNPPDKPIAPDAPPAEEYLELYCQNQVVPTSMTLASIRQYIWKNSGDVALYYKSNGKWSALDQYYKIGEYSEEAEASAQDGATLSQSNGPVAVAQEA